MPIAEDASYLSMTRAWVTLR